MIFFLTLALAQEVLLTPQAQIHLNGEERARSQAVFSPAERALLKKLGAPHLAHTLKVQTKRNLTKHKGITSRTLPLKGFGEELSHLQWGMKNQGLPQEFDLSEFERVKVPGRRGEDVGITGVVDSGSLVKVAVLDTGIDLKHPDLKDQVLRKESECQALAEYEACDTAECRKEKKAVDSDGNGYPLDCRGWNFTGRNKLKEEFPDLVGDSKVQDVNGHGTHVAGIVGAAQDGWGVAGVAPKVKLLPLKVIAASPNEPIRPQSAGSSLMSEGQAQPTQADYIAKALLYAINERVQVINMSLGWPLLADTSLLREMVALAQEQGIAVVAAAGNDSTDAIIMPCQYKGVVCVGAHGPDGALSHFSNHGPGVDLAAPGLSILSTWPMDRRAYRFNQKTGFELKNGTSQAAPFVAGLIARLMARGLDAGESFSRLFLGARPTQEDPSGKVLRSGNADLLQALKVRPQPLILPVQKHAPAMSWDGLAQETTLKLKFKNHWVDAKSVELQVSTPRPRGLVAQGSFDLGPMDQGETKEIVLPVQVIEQSAHGVLDLSLRLLVDGKELILPFRAKLNLPVSPDFLALPHRKFTLPPGVEDLELSSVIALSDQGRQDYLARGEEGRFQILAPQDDRYVSLGEGQSEEGDLLWVNRVGETYSFFRQVLRREGKRVALVRFETYTKDLTPITSYELDLEAVGIIDEDFQFMAHGSRHVPAWVGRGKRPKSEIEFDPWKTDEERLIEEEAMELRFYYLDEEGAHTVSAPDDWFFATSLPSEKMGVVPVLLARGEGFALEFGRAEVTQGRLGEISLLDMEDGYRMLGGLEVAPTFSLNPDEAPTCAFDGLGGLEDHKVTVLRGTQTQGQRLQALIPYDRINRVVGTYTQGQELRIFTQTHYELQYHEAGETVRTSLQKFSFLPAYFFNRTLFPILAKEGGARTPAILIPAGLGVDQATEVVIPRRDSQGLYLARPALFRLEPTQECQLLLNPIQEPGVLATQVSARCGDQVLRIRLSLDEVAQTH